MNQLYCPLSLPVNFFNDKFDIKKFKIVNHQRITHENISKEYFDFLSHLNIKLNHVELFITLPNLFLRIHKDQHGMNDFPKINFIIGGKSSTMNWYKPKSDSVGKIQNTSIATPYIGYDLEEVDLIFSKEIHSPSIVQAGVPHNVTTPVPRWAFSTVYISRDNKLLTWEEILNIFKDYIIK